MALPAGCKWVEKVLDKHFDNIASLMNYLVIDKDKALYAVTELYRWGEKSRQSYLHMYYNAAHGVTDFDYFTRQLIGYRDEILMGKAIEKHEEFYKRYLIIRKAPKCGLRGIFNEDEIQKYRKHYSGFFCILPNKIKSAKRLWRSIAIKTA